jgi:hypothetical protein
VRRIVLSAAFITLLGSQERFEPLRGSLARQAVQPVYSADLEDPWNQAFFLLFTRTIRAQLAAEGAAPFAAGDERLRVSDRRVTRIESGDRAIDPLYPSWIWMGSSAFDFAPAEPWRILQGPQYSQLVAALDSVRRSAAMRPKMARALMQADLWSVYDTLHSATSVRGAARALRGSAERASALLNAVADTMRALALSRDEIARLPDNYAAAARRSTLPDVRNRTSGWVEIRWFPNRSHDEAATLRRASQVFVKPGRAPSDLAAFLDSFREASGRHGDALDSVALVTELLLIASDGGVVPSPITYDVQLRGKAARTRAGETPEYELSRRTLLSSPSSGGLLPIGATEPAYIPISGNDFSFAAPPKLDGDPVVVPLSFKCSVCHGGPGVGHLMTFSRATGPGVALPHVETLDSAANPHALSIAAGKMERADYKALRAQWR